ncbi:MAG: ABC transporter permease [Planctomycetota bacterium]|nr:ABC transporter permease [Planctomycetota bacterium]
MYLFNLRTWQLGVKSLLLHPLRSLLTVLGIFIGVASVIWLLAIGEGISNKAQEQIAGLGAENIIVRSVKPPSEATVGFRANQYGLTRSDYQRLIQIPTVQSALCIREIRRQFRYKDRLVDGRLVATTPEYLEATQQSVAKGAFISHPDNINKLNYCVLAAGTAARLFPYEDPIGEELLVGDDYYRIIGVMKPRAASAGIGGSLAAQDYNNDVYIPIQTLWKRIGDMIFTRSAGSFESEIQELTQVTLRVSGTENVVRTADAIEQSLKFSHKQEDYSITVPLELIEQAKTTRMMFIVLLGFIAAISLVVGGIGIMNIMLATVTERTREIGIRRALGAKRRDITRQFLAETMVLSAVGGVTGILGGLTVRPVISEARSFLESTFPKAMENLPDLVKSVEPEVVSWSIPLAFGISVLVGVIFGIYPAIRAAKMDPIEALRHQ